MRGLIMAMLVMALHLPSQGAVGKSKIQVPTKRTSAKNAPIHRISIDEGLMPAWQAAIVRANKAPIQGLILRKLPLCKTAGQQQEILTDLVRVLKAKAEDPQKGKKKRQGSANGQATDDAQLHSNEQNQVLVMANAVPAMQQVDDLLYSGLAEALMLILAVRNSDALHQQVLYALRLLPQASVMSALPALIKALALVDPFEVGFALQSIARSCGTDVRKYLGQKALPILYPKLCMGIESVTHSPHTTAPDTALGCIQSVVSILEGTNGAEEQESCTSIQECGPAIIRSLASVLMRDSVSHDTHISAALGLCMLLNSECEDVNVRADTLKALVSVYVNTCICVCEQCIFCAEALKELVRCHSVCMWICGYVYVSGVCSVQRTGGMPQCVYISLFMCVCVSKQFMYLGAQRP
jgi:hypothetical protein